MKKQKFIEGDGTLGIKNSSPYLQIAQKNTSKATLEAIKLFISTQLVENTTGRSPDFQVPATNVTSALNKKTGVVSLVVNNIDSLYYNILPRLPPSVLH